MTSWRLILREFLHRKANSVLALLSVAVAVACLVASVSALRGYDLETEQVLTRMQKKTEDRVSELKDAYRKIVLKLGFNIFIIPQDVDLHQRHTAGIGGHDMPEEYVTRLANSGIITIDHLLPSLSAAVNWPEQKLQIVLTGVRGEVAIAGKKRKRPLLQPVDKGQIVLGKKVAEVAGLKKGDKTTLLGAEFVVFKTHDARGTQDDNTVWIDLTKAQELLGKEGKITAIQAINCLAPHCHPTAEGIPEVTDEISAVLPDTQVLIDMAKAKTRIDARHRAAEEATAALQQETERRAATRTRWDRLAAVVNPLLIIAACAWIGMLAVANVRERRFEIGVLCDRDDDIANLRVVSGKGRRDRGAGCRPRDSNWRALQRGFARQRIFRRRPAPCVTVPHDADCNPGVCADCRDHCQLDSRPPRRSKGPRNDFAS